MVQVNSASESVNPLRDAALNCGRHGMKIFPITAGTKDKPLVKAWGTAATSDPAAIAAWWKQWPNANIGFACAANGVGVLDVDKKADADGARTLGLLELERGHTVPPTRTARTPSGGTHYFFDGLFPTSVRKIGRDLVPNSGLDTRGSGGEHGGYVLLAPSIVGGKPYTWVDTRKLAKAPAWIAQEIGAAEHASAKDQEPLVDLDQPGNVAWAKHYLATDAAPSIQDKGGDDNVLRVCAVLKDRAISEHLACQLMAEIWNPRCEPPWQLGECADADNLFVKIRNAYEYCRNRAPGEGTAEADFAGDEPPEGPPGMGDAANDNEKSGRRERLKARSWDELQELPDPKWLLQNMIPDEGLTIIYGKPKRGKSFLALEFSLCVATGESFFGETIGRSGLIVYVAAEGGAASVRNRVRAWIKARGIEGDKLQKLKDNWGLIDTGLQLNSPDSIKRFLNLNPGKRVLVVFDTLARNIQGDESNAKDMSAAIKGVDIVREQTGAAAVLVHHEGWSAARLRGSSVLQGAPDAVLRVSRDTKTNYTVLVAEDMREAPGGTTMAFRLGDDGVMHRVSVDPAGKETTADKILNLLCTLHQARDGEPVPLAIWRNGAKAQQLIDGGEAGRKIWERALKALHAGKRVKHHKGDKYSPAFNANDLNEAAADFADDAPED